MAKSQLLSRIRSIAMVISLAVDNGQKGVCSQLWPYVDMLKDERAVGGFKMVKKLVNWQQPIFIHIFLLRHGFWFFSARKHGLVDAAVRSSNLEKTVMIALPGGIGTLDKAFDILGLIQI